MSEKRGFVGCGMGVVGMLEAVLVKWRHRHIDLWTRMRKTWTAKENPDACVVGLLKNWENVIRGNYDKK